MPPPERAEGTETTPETFFQHYRQEIPSLFHLEFPYLEQNRLQYRKSKYGKTEFEYNEKQLSNGLFPVEEQGILDLLKACEDEETGMGEADIKHIIPALHIYLYAHQTQFRESGEPYTIHPLEMAVEAARDYKADWQTIALCLLHDVKEDGKKYKKEIPPWVVESIYVNSFRGENNENLTQAIKDAKFLVKGMDALSKARTTAEASLKRKTIEKGIELFRHREREKDAARETVKKLYNAVLSDKDGKTEELSRVVLVKLLDRKHNMKTIQFMPTEKQFEKATETLLVYAPMADAFHLYKLAEELRQLALEILEPEVKDEINQELKVRMQLISDYQSTKILDLIKEGMNQKRSECLQMNFIPPSYNEIYEAMDIYPYEFSDSLRIQMVMEDLPGETEDAWKVRMRNMLNVLVQSLQFEGEKFALQMIAENSAEQKIDAVLNFEKDGLSRRQISVHIIGRKTYLAENASLLDLFTRSQREFGNKEDWQNSALKNISNIRKNYKKSKGKDLGLFFETVGGQKIVFDKKGSPISLPSKATLFDALWMMYGEDVLRSTEVYVKDGKNIVTVRRDDFGKQLNDRAQIKGLEVWTLDIAQQPAVLPTDIRNSYVSHVREQLIDYIENKQAQPENARQNIIDYGYRFIRSHYNDVWDHLKREEYFQQTIHAFVNLSPPLVHHVYEQAYPTIEDLAYAVGSGRIKKSLYHRLIKEMIQYRDECIYIALGALDYPSKAHLIPQILAEYKLSPLKHKEDMYRDPYPEVTNNYQMWFHPSQLGEEAESKLEEMIGRFEKEGFNITADRNAYKALPIIYGELPQIEISRGELFEVI